MSSAPLSPVPSQRRGLRRRTVIVLVVLTVIAAVIGVGVAVYRGYSANERNQLITVRRQLDRVPLPAGASLTDTISNEANGDASAYLERRYKLTSTTPGAQIRSTLAAAHFRLVPTRGGAVAPVSSPTWSTYASARTGDVYVRPPWASSGAVEIQWVGNKLFLSLRSGDLS